MEINNLKTLDSKESLNGSGSTSSGSSRELALAFYSPPKPERPLLSFAASILFLAGENSGVGLLALPSALKHSSEYGIFLMLLVSSLCTYCGVILGKSCTIFAERHHSHYPHYPLIGYHAFGPVCFIVVWLTIHITTVGVCTADILQITSAITDITGFCECYVVIVVVVLLCPFTYFGSPKDFWWVAYFSLGSTSLSVILMNLLFIHKIIYPGYTNETTLIDYFIASQNATGGVLKTEQSEESGFLERGTTAVSVIIFAFAGISLFPTVIIDMENKVKSPAVIIVAQVILVVLYIPYAILAYYAYKEDIKDSILENISEQVMLKYSITLLMAIYLCTAFIMHFNHTTIEIEHLLGIQLEVLTWKRIAFRTFEVTVLLFLSLTIPTFGNVVHIIGGSVSTLLTLVFPPLFYIRITSLRNASNKHWPDRKLGWVRFSFACLTFLLGIVVCIVCTIYNIRTVAREHHAQKPCYDLKNITFGCLG